MVTIYHELGIHHEKGSGNNGSKEDMASGKILGASVVKEHHWVIYQMLIKKIVKGLGKYVPGFGMGSVGNHYNRSSLTMYMYLTNITGLIIIIIGRWLPNTFFLYICN